MITKPPLSSFRDAGSTVYVSGQLPRDKDGAIIDGTVQEQTRQSLANLQGVLVGAGLALPNVVKVTVWLTDARHLNDFNAVYREFFTEPYPARSVIISALVAHKAIVEIEAVAFRPSEDRL